MMNWDKLMEFAEAHDYVFRFTNSKKAIPGKYKIQVDYYGSRQQKIAGPTTIMMQAFTNYGKEAEKKQEMTLRLTDLKEIVDVGEIEFR